MTFSRAWGSVIGRLEQLAEGSPRNDVMGGFLYSPEFTDFMGYLGF